MIDFIKRRFILIGIVILIVVYAYNNYFKIVEGNTYIDKKSPFYINDLYLSNGLHYKNLNNNNQKLYNEMLKYYVEFEEYPVIDLKDYGCSNLSNCDISIISSYNALMMDHPELIQVAGVSYKYYNDSSLVEIHLKSGLRLNFQYNLGVKRIEIMIDEIKTKTKNMTEKEKIKYVYEWIGNHSSYDKIFTSSSKNQSVYSVFIGKSGVCAAFAKASQLIFQNIGIESYTVTGESTGLHMWNIVKVDGNYYFYDSTVASSLKKDSSIYYDGLKQSYINTFKLDNQTLYPKTSSNEYLISN